MEHQKVVFEGYDRAHQSFKTMGHKALARMKAIVNKDQKVDLDAFCESELDEFWSEVVDYIHKNNNTKESGVFKRRKFVNVKVLIEALTTIIGRLKPTQLHTEALPNVVKIFAALLHPDTPGWAHQQTLPTVMKLLEKVKTEDWPALDAIVKMLVPFVKLARNEPEKTSLMNCVLEETQALADKNKGQEITKEEVLGQLRVILNYVHDNWQERPQLCVMVLRRVLFTVYKDVAAEAGVTANCGFIGTVPQDVHSSVFHFVSQFLKHRLDWKPIFDDKDFGKFWILLMQHAALYPMPECCSTALHVLSDICRTREVISAILKKTPDLINSFIGTVGSILFVSLVNHELPESIVAATCDFIGAFFPALFQERELSDMLDMMEKAFEKYKSHALVLSVFYVGFVAAVFGRQDQNPATWEFIVNCVRHYDDISAANGKYAQYLVLLLFPSLLGLNIEETLSKCEDLNRKRERTKQVSASDWFCDNLQKIVSEPHLFACQSLPLKWGKPIDYPLIIPKRQQEFVPTDMIDHFLNVFEVYKKSQDIMERRRLFSAFHGMYRTLLKVVIIPSSIKFDRNAAFVYSANKLLNGIFHETDTVIQLECFEMMAEFMLHTSLKQLLRDNILSQWYSAILVCLFSKDKKLSEFALTTGIKTVQIGFVGSGMLLPVLLNYSEKVLKVEAIPLITSIALFTSDASVPDSFKSGIKSLLSAQSDMFVDFAADILDAPASSLRERAQKLVLPLCELVKDGKNDTEGASKNILIPMLSAVIADELTQDKPDIRIICFLMTTMCDLIENQVWETISVLKNLIITFSDRLRDEKEFAEVVERILGMRVPELSKIGKQGMLHLMQLKYETIIHHPVWALPHFKKFVEGIRGVSKRDQGTEELKAQATAMLVDLSIRFKNYPFPNSPLFIRNVDNYNRDGQLCALANKTILSIGSEEDGYVVDSEIIAGHFRWKFNSVPHLADREKCEEFTFPGTMTEPTVTGATSFEKSFSEKWNTFVDRMGSLSFNLNVDNLKEVEDRIQLSRQVFENNHGSARPPVYRDADKNYVASAAAVSPLLCSPADLWLVKKNEQVDLKVKEFDDFEHRYHSKLAILYVPQDVYDQNEILAKTLSETSPHFQEFLHGVGSPVDMATHHLYVGGLDRTRCSTGTSSVYYADSAYDIMYHVAPLMPTSSSDEQQILKKRHVGNDHVHIVWCDNLCEYDVQTISSQFNEVHIIIYPLQTGLFRIDVRSKSDCGWFGPLRETTIVTKRMLPSLVRLCAIGAMVSVNEKKVPLCVPPWQPISQILLVSRARILKPGDKVPSKPAAGSPGKPGDPSKPADAPKPKPKAAGPKLDPLEALMRIQAK